ncbi:MAG: LLM class flavin-dependent oxidoreductase [Dehalococcoidia bacterium]
MGTNPSTGSEQRRARIGILLPTRGIVLKAGGGPVDAAPLLEMAQAAEALSLDSVWVGDSLLSKPRLEPLTTLAAVASRTSRVRLGTAILMAGMRQPVQLAQAVATLDILSRGRVVLAIGIGGVFTPALRNEWVAAGAPPAQRAGRLEELLVIMRRLWAGEAVTFQGRYFTLEDAALGLRPAQDSGVPLLLACHHRTGSEAQYRRAARLADGIISITDSPQEFAQVLSKVRQVARQEGRDLDSAEAAYYMTVNLNADEEQARQEAIEYATAYYGSNIGGDRWGPYGHPERVAARMREYAQAGATTLIVRFASPDPLGQLDLFAREVLPGV